MRMKLAIAIMAMAVCMQTSAKAPRVDRSFGKDNAVVLGAYYYPEQWDSLQWARDLKLMSSMGINFTHFGEFAWGRIQPEEGVWDFAWLDKAVELAANEGLKVVMCTPTPCPPAWLTQKHPDVMIERGNGVTISHGTREHASWSSPVYLGYVEEVVERLAERYGNNPAVIGWQLDNEPSHYGIIDYSENSQKAFRRWLQRKYGSIENLNDVWGTAFWSEYYNDFDQIRLPNPEELVAKANPHAMLDMNRYFADELADYLNFQADVLRRHISDDQWITTNLMPVVDPADPPRLDHLDFTTYTRYMCTGFNTGIGDQGFRIGLPEQIGMPNDIHRNGPGNAYGVMELQPGQVNWGTYNPQPLPGAVSLWIWHVWAGGSKFICNYRFRQPLKGSEQYHYGLVLPDGISLSPGGKEYTEIAKISKEMAKHAKRNAKMPKELSARRTAIMLTPDNRWETEFQPQTNQWNTMDHVTKYYNVLTAMGAPIDIIGEDKDLAEWPFVIAPAFELLDSALVERWDEYVRNGGNLVLTCRTGQKNREAKIWEGPWAAPIRDLVGIEEMYYDHLPSSVYGKIEGDDSKEYLWNNWADVITPSADADVWAVYADQYYAGKAAVLHRHIGKGTVTYIGSDTDDANLENDVLRRLYEEEGVSMESLPRGVIKSWRDGFNIVLNYTSDPIDVEIPSDAKIFLGGRRLPAAGVAIWMER